jgi:hypothetical protein
LLHTQEELAPRNLLDNTVRCLMPFLARGHHSPDEGGEDGGSAPGWLWGEFWIQVLSSDPAADPAAGCVEAHGRIADQRCQVRLKALELGGSDLPLPLIAQLVEGRLALAHHLEAERGDLKEHAAGVAGVCVACHVSALLQDRDGLRRCLPGDGQAAAEF